MGDILKDNRFSKYLNDPRYRQIPKHERKVKIDKRFESMFKDEKFRVKYTVDKRGRPVNETSTENLRKYYDLDESEDDTSEEEEDTLKKDDGKSKGEVEDEADTSGQLVRRPDSGDDANVPKLVNDKLERGKLDKKTKKRLLDLDIDYARGEGFLQTDSSSDDESSEEEEDSELEHEWGELDADAETTDEATRRIALCNMDWDNIKAVDIMVLLNSFLPPGGVIESITIYPSEFGLRRMREEDMRGPAELTARAAADRDDDGDEENEEGSAYHMEKLRRYQLARLRYHYAVVRCDAAATAARLYAECDGLEWESSATRLDMRFVPDDVTFDQEPREVCTKLPEPSQYKPRLFTTTALQQAKVELTWDATSPARAAALRGALSGAPDDPALREYLASSSDDEDDVEKPPAADSASDAEADPIQKYKSLLQEIEQKEDKKRNKDMELEITWGLGVKDKADELKKKIQEEKKDLTPFEQLMEKKREKKRQKKLEKKQKLDRQPRSDSDADDAPSDVDMNDPYFAEEFDKPEFKKSKKPKKPTEDTTDEEEEKRKAELQLLLDDEDDGKAHFSLKKIQEAEGGSNKSKRKKKLKQKMAEEKQALPDFEVDVHDERFAALYNSHLFNIDPSDPNFKKTKNMEKIIHEKLKRRPADTPAGEQAPKRSREDAEMSLLVKNIKRKTKNAVKK